MGYSKQNFVNGMVLMAEHLNTIEDQIALNADHNHDSAYDTKGASVLAEANAKVYAKNYTDEQIQAAINATWEASY